MRSAFTCIGLALATSVGILALPGCTLYFGGGGQSYDDYADDQPDGGSPWYPDAYVPPSSNPVSFARCEDSTIRHVALDDLPSMMPGHGAGTLAGTCPNGCRSAIAQCMSPSNCAQADLAVCNAPVATGPVSSFQGQSCSASSTVTYTNTNHCGQVFAGGTCTCDASTSKYACTASTDTAGIHTSLVGKWRGTVTPPNFGSPYQISLWIYPDGTYWAECASTSCSIPFYYGGSGPHPWRKISVLSASSQLGATADIGMFYSDNIGALTSMFVTQTTLRFTFYAAWFGCTQPFDVSLTRN